MFLSALSLCLVLFAAACGLPSSPAPGPSDITVMRARFENLTGEPVRWGGEVASVTPTERETCFEVIARPLKSDGAPLDSAQSDGRFLACTPQFYARGIYEGQDVTVTGVLDTPVTTKVDEREYRYPRVANAALHFWPRAPESLNNLSLRRPWKPGDVEEPDNWR